MILDTVKDFKKYLIKLSLDEEQEKGVINLLNENYFGDIKCSVEDKEILEKQFFDKLESIVGTNTYISLPENILLKETEKIYIFGDKVCYKTLDVKKEQKEILAVSWW